MASKAKKGLKGSIDDVFGDLLGDETALPEKPLELASQAGGAGAPQGRPSKAKARSLRGDSVDNTPAEADVEVSLISEADPQALLRDMKDLDSMDADLLGLKKTPPALGKRTAKGSGKDELPSNPKPAGRSAASERGDAAPTRKPPPSPSRPGLRCRRQSFADLEDPLAGLSSDDEEGIAEKPPVADSKGASVQSPSTAREQGPCIPLTPGDTPIRKKEESLFDDGDDIMATLGFGDSPKADRRLPGDQDLPRPARSTLDELLGRGTATKVLALPGSGQHGEFKLDRKYQRPQEKEDTWGHEDLIFGAYQPTVAGEGQQSRRQSVRFLAEGGPDPKREPASKQSPPAAPSPVCPRKGGADWLGLKDDDLDLLPSSPTRESRRGGSVISASSGPPPASQHAASDLHPVLARLPSGAKPPAEDAASPVRSSQASKLGVSEEKDDEDWLSHVLSRKKSQGLGREEHPGARKSLNSVGTLGPPPPDSQPIASTREPAPAAAGGTSGARETAVSRPDLTGSPVNWSRAALPLPSSDPKRGATPGERPGTEPAVCFLNSQEPTGLSVPVQVGRVDR